MDEVKIRNIADKVAKYVNLKAKERDAKLSAISLQLLSGLENTKWEDAYEATSPYRRLADSLRLACIQTELSFLTLQEAKTVKEYLDFISDNIPNFHN